MSLSYCTLRYNMIQYDTISYTIIPYNGRQHDSNDPMQYDATQYNIHNKILLWSSVQFNYVANLNFVDRGVVHIATSIQTSNWLVSNMLTWFYISGFKRILQLCFCELRDSGVNLIKSVSYSQPSVNVTTKRMGSNLIIILHPRIIPMTLQQNSSTGAECCFRQRCPPDFGYYSYRCHAAPPPRTTLQLLTWHQLLQQRRGRVSLPPPQSKS